MRDLGLWLYGDSAAVDLSYILCDKQIETTGAPQRKHVHFLGSWSVLVWFGFCYNQYCFGRGADAWCWISVLSRDPDQESRQCVQGQGWYCFEWCCVAIVFRSVSQPTFHGSVLINELGVYSMFGCQPFPPLPIPPPLSLPPALCPSPAPLFHPHHLCRVDCLLIRVSVSFFFVNSLHSLCCMSNCTLVWKMLLGILGGNADFEILLQKQIF